MIAQAIWIGTSAMMARSRPSAALSSEPSGALASETGFESMLSAPGVVSEARAGPVAGETQASVSDDEKDAVSESVSDPACGGACSFPDDVPIGGAHRSSLEELGRRAGNGPDSDAFQARDGAVRDPADEVGNPFGASVAAILPAPALKALGPMRETESPPAQGPNPFFPSRWGRETGSVHLSSGSADKSARLSGGVAVASSSEIRASIGTTGQVLPEGDLRDAAQLKAEDETANTARSAERTGKLAFGNSVDARHSPFAEDIGGENGKAYTPFADGGTEAAAAGPESRIHAVEGGGSVRPTLAQGPSALPEVAIDAMARRESAGRAGAGNMLSQGIRPENSHPSLSDGSEEAARGGSAFEGIAPVLSRTLEGTERAQMPDGFTRYLPPTAVLSAGPVEDLAGQPSRLPSATVAPAPHLQLADAIVAAGDGVVEITLNPHELGRVKVTITGDRADLQVGMIVERSDTFDLLRRHADLLLRDLKDSGIDHAQLEFVRQDDGRRDSEGATAEGRREAGNGGSGPERGVGPSNSGTAPESAQENAGADGRIEPGRRLDIRM